MLKSRAIVAWTVVLAAATLASAEFTDICLRSKMFPLSGGRYYWYADGYSVSNCNGDPRATAIVAHGSDGPDVVCTDCIQPARAPASAEEEAPQRVTAEQSPQAADEDADAQQPASALPDDVEVPVAADFDYYKQLKISTAKPRPRRAHPLASRRLFRLPRINDNGFVRAYLFLVTMDVERPPVQNGGQPMKAEVAMAIGFETEATGPAVTVNPNELHDESAYIDDDGQHVDDKKKAAYYRFDHDGEVCEAIVYLVDEEEES